MVKIESIVLGYRVLLFPFDKFGDACSLLFKFAIPFSQKGYNSLYVNEKYLKSATALMDKEGIEYEISLPKGALGVIKAYGHKTAFIAALFFAIVLTVALSNIVWDIRVSGNECFSDSEVISAMENAGLCRGAFWHKINVGKIEAKALSNSDGISWVNINRRGTIAYVVVREKSVPNSETGNDSIQYSNLIASEDCVIEEIDVFNGTAAVKVGDTVKSGDILILGITSEDEEGGFCKARGQIIGRIYGSVSLEVGREKDEVNVQERKIEKISIKIFNFSTNILKIYRNLDEEYDIIEEKSIVSFFGLCNLPIEITKSYVVTYSHVSREMSDSEMIDIASYRLNAMLIKKFSDVDLCAIKTYGNFNDTAYEIGCDYVYLCNVAVESPIYFDVDDTEGK